MYFKLTDDKSNNNARLCFSAIKLLVKKEDRNEDKVQNKIIK